MLERRLPACIVIRAQRVLDLIEKHLPSLLVGDLIRRLYHIICVSVHEQVLDGQLVLLTVSLLADTIWQVHNLVQDLEKLGGVGAVLLAHLNDHSDRVLDELASIFLDGHDSCIALD